MQKRKLKLNVLDVAIFVVVICSVAVLLFRDTITEVFGKPEISAIEITVTSDYADEGTKMSLNIGATAEVVLGHDKTVPAVVTSAEFPSNGSVVLKLSLNGYEKMGRIYTENGHLLDVGSDCSVLVNGTVLSIKLKNVGFSG